MANQMVVFLENYDRRIQFLRSQGDQLLDSIKSLEIGMNRRKQHLEQPHKAEIDWMYCMVKTFFGKRLRKRSLRRKSFNVNYKRTTERLIFTSRTGFKYLD